MMVSPFVRRRRLAMEILRLRDEYEYSADRLASAVGVKRQTISRIENGHVRPDPDPIMRILAVFNVGEKRWAQIMTIAREAQERGWWERHAEQMGPRQALAASLEAGAQRIFEYQMTLLPGLLQTPTFSQARVHADPSAHTEGVEPARALEARITRQRLLDRPGGPVYDVVVDELAIRRFAAPVAVVGGSSGIWPTSGARRSRSPFEFCRSPRRSPVMSSHARRSPSTATRIPPTRS